MFLYKVTPRQSEDSLCAGRNADQMGILVLLTLFLGYIFLALAYIFP